MKILLFLLLWIIILIAVPVFKIARRIHSFRRQMRDFASGARQTYSSGRATSSSPFGANVNQQPAPRKKKIDSDVGEYVDYEEVAATVTETEGEAYAGVVEDQVSDAEWEDVR